MISVSFKLKVEIQYGKSLSLFNFIRKSLIVEMHSNLGFNILSNFSYILNIFIDISDEEDINKLLLLQKAKAIIVLLCSNNVFI